MKRLFFLLFLTCLVGSSYFYPTENVFSQNNYQMKLGEPLPSNIFIELAKKINPSVVSISVSMNLRNQIPRGMNRDPFWDFFEQFVQPMPEDRDPNKNRPVGTGFIIEEDGTIVTNYHVIDNVDAVYVHLSQDKEKAIEAKIIGGDQRTDIAVIKIDTGKRLPTADLGDSDKLEVGEWVAAFGNPFGHEFSMSKGIISAKGRKIRELNAIPFLQTDASINPGNSGGPLVNLKGQVIGVNTAIDARGPGIGFAIPINHVRTILPQLKSTGRVARGFIGIQIDNISRRAQSVLNLKSANGALVMGVQPGGPADKAGLRAYDVITQFNNVTIESAEDLIDAVKDHPIGKIAQVDILRENKKLNLKILIDNPPEEMKLAKKPQRSKRGDDAPFSIGFKVVDFSTQVAQELGIDPNRAPRNPIVVEVQKGSPAAQNGLRIGDIILDVNQKPVRSAKEVIQALKKGSNILRVQNKNQVSLIFLDI